MKKTFTFFFVVLLSQQLFSQAVDSIKNYTWVGNTWVLDGVTDFSYNTSCAVTSGESKDYNSATQTYTNSSLFSYLYNPNASLRQSVFQEWNTGTSTYDTSLRITYTYVGSTTRVANMLIENWSNGSAENFYLSTLTYDGNNYTIDSTVQQWNSSSNAWENFSKTTITNNSAGMPTTTLTKIWSDLTNSYEDFTKDTLIYNSSMWLTSRTVMQAFPVLGWVTTQRYTYTYDANGRLLTTLSETGSPLLPLTNSYLITNTYNTDGTLNMTTTQNWVGGAWVNSTQQRNVNASCTLLPLVLTSFKGTMEKENASLTWRTASEVNTAYFNIERSVNGTDFSVVGRVAAVGNSAGNVDYSFSDRFIQSAVPTVYYRLSMYDRDGKFTYSNTLRFTINRNNLALNIIPNPATNYIRLFTNTTSGTVTLSNATGHIVMQKVLNGTGEQKLNVMGLPKGMYILKLTTLNGVRSQKVLVK